MLAERLADNIQRFHRLSPNIQGNTNKYYLPHPARILEEYHILS